MPLLWKPADERLALGDQIADVNSNTRLHVRRGAPRSRDFVGFLNGRRLGCWRGVDLAKQRCEEIARVELAAGVHK